ncbi:hypothetical protein JW992_16200 [candidate division KSB1 bacterium]|nr:hypothetical protein [candidate division KSB1 bacterium]
MRHSIIGSITIAIVFFVGSGCSFLEPEPEIPLLIWYGDPAPSIASRTTQELGDAGFTIIHNGTHGRERNRIDLSVADSIGVKLLVADRRLLDAAAGKLSPEAAVDSVIEDYHALSSLWGYFVAENPSRRDFYRLGRIQARLAEKDPERPAWFFIPGPDTQAADLSMPSYASYLTHFLEVVRPKILAAALMPSGNYTAPPLYFQHLDFLSAVSVRYRVPFWGAVYCLAADPFSLPHHSNLRLQAYSALAYGARGIHYYAYQPPHSMRNRARSAFLRENGQLNQLYWELKRLNREIQYLAPALHDLAVEAVYHTEPVPQGCRPLPNHAPIYRIDRENMLISFLVTPRGERYALLVNKNTSRGTRAEIYLGQSVNCVIEIGKNGLFDRQTVWSATREQDMLALLFKAGDGILLKLE